SSADTNSPVGTYPIMASGVSNGNYQVSFTDGTLTVTNALLTVTAGDTNKVYGQTVTFAGTEFTVSGLVSTDSVSSASLSSDGAVAGAGVAGSPYSIAITNAVGDDGLTNYLITYVPGTLTINKAAATIVVTPYNVTYDGTAHMASGTATGVMSDGLGGLDLSGTTHTAAGSYTGDGWTFTDTTGNYNNASGTVNDAIGRAALTVTANDASRGYGQTNPVFTVSYSGFVNGQT